MSHEYEVPTANFPNPPDLINIGGQDVWEYLEPRQIDTIIEKLAKNIDFSEYDAVIVNMRGGKYLYDRLKEKNNYQGGFVPVEYHRPDNGIGVEITIPIPEYLHGKKCLLIDDISDRGHTFMKMLEKLSPNSKSVALVSKKDIKDKADVPNLLIGVLIDGKVWIAGCGMDLGYEGEKDEFRNHGGIVVKIPKEITPHGEWIY